MSTPSGTDLTHHTRTELETMRRNAHAESLRLYDAAIAITTEQGKLGYAIETGGYIDGPSATRGIKEAVL